MEHDVRTLRGRRADQRWNRVSVGDLLERVTWSTPDKVALVGCEGAYSDARFHRVTYSEGDQIANQIAHALLAEGLEPGSRILLYCDNSVEAMLTMIGIAKAGMVAVPVNPLLAPDVLKWAMGHAEISLAIVDAGLFPRVAETFREFGLHPRVSIALDAGPVKDTSSFGDWIDGQPKTEVGVSVHGDDVWALVFTSGTTSMPKASMMTHTYSYMSSFAYAMSLTRGLKHETDLVACTFMPIIYHCGHNSTPLPAFISGGTIVLGRRPDAVKLAAAVTQERVTAAWLGSPMWVEKLIEVAEQDSRGVDLSSLCVAMFAWGAMRPDISERLDRICGEQVQMLEVFGQTEAMSCFRFWPGRSPEKHQESIRGVNHVGVPNPLLAADIHDAEGNSLRGKPGIPGEAVYRSPVITAGYYKDEQATAEAFRDGWFHSGDSCVFTEDGTQIMVDRFKDIVKSGGENVSSMRVEGVLSGHPAVERVAVIGLEDEKWGEVVTAVVVARKNTKVDESELIAYSREHLAGFEAPKRVIVIDDMPATVGGKIMKFRLREMINAAVNPT
ncbi:AMP-dependent synthetase [Arthrobacter sp. UCD-GKA]|uniref:AMP-binding protein n=1 Tax=Arthrobacter sp. UCD-GKA TaxID=1913576 RepID=UPI0008DE14E4|nr:AMP-binding protein [Arthrobacter sp. UCD-GKA]OIH85208.1 AMP-dependent synthetase [Arthrobacter sp. UCD-GKA]